MEIFWKDLPVIEEEDELVKEKEATKSDVFFENVMKERAELFQALIDKVNEHEISYIGRHSWLFGR